MQDHNIVLNNSILTGHIDPIGLHGGDFLSQSENSGTTDNRHFTVLVKYGIPIKYTQCATIVLASCEHKIECHEKVKLILIG